jgi:acetoin utilization deacetylase AcuC-like enzyme
LPQGTADRAYLEALERALAELTSFAPRWLVVSAGFDTVAGDPEGGFRLTREGLAAVGQRIAGLDVPTVIVQEGGYQVERMGEDAVAFLRAFV